jgi:nucleoside-diphosphate-sugar epimerase
MASPVSLEFTDPDPILHAAVNGTKAVLASAKRNAGPQLQSFVLTSSMAAILNECPAPYTYTEEDWNLAAPLAVAKLGKNTPGLQIYGASKTAAERAMWEFRDEQKPSFTLAAINPG